MSDVKQLSSLCLDCIAENFNRFMFAYTSGNFIPKLYFEFLQRKYSAHLLERLACAEEFENYIDFLFNPFLKEIDLHNYRHNIALIVNRLIDIGPTITSLKLPKSDYGSNSLVKLFTSLPNLESLELRGKNISLVVFRSIGNNCRNLKTLIASCQVITNEYVKALYTPSDEDVNECNLSTSLEQLIFRQSQITIEGLKYALKNFRNIYNLQSSFRDCGEVFLALYELHADDTNNYDNLREYKLRKLAILNPKNYPVEFLELCGRLLPYVADLLIRDINSQAQIDALQTFSSLEKLYVTFLHNSCDLSPILEKNRNNLKSLHIQNGIISLNSLLKFCPKLESLIIINNYNSADLSIEDDTSTSDCLLNHCKKLCLMSFNFHEDMKIKFAKRILSRCPNLEKLCFTCSVGLSANFVQGIAFANGIKTLKKLNLTDTDIELSSVKHLVQNASNLEIVKLIYCKNFNEQAIECLKILKPSIKSVFL